LESNSFSYEFGEKMDYKNIHPNGEFTTGSDEPFPANSFKRFSTSLFLFKIKKRVTCQLLLFIGLA
jgi:hypothetical protein